MGKYELDFAEKVVLVTGGSTGIGRDEAGLELDVGLDLVHQWRVAALRASGTFQQSLRLSPL